MSQNNAQAVQPENGHIAMSLAMAVLAVLTDAANNVAQYIVSDGTSIEGVLSVLDGVLANLEMNAKRFKTFTGDFDRFCDKVREGSIA